LRPKWKGIKALHTDFPPQWNRHSRLGGPTGVALTSLGYAGPRLPEGIWAAPPIRAPEGFIEGNTPRLLPVRPALPLHLPLCGPSQLLIVPHQPPNLSSLPTLFGSARSQCRGRHLRQLGIADAGLGRCCTGRQPSSHAWRPQRAASSDGGRVARPRPIAGSTGGQSALGLLRGSRFGRLAENPAAAFAQVGALSLHAGGDPFHVGNFR
jgi:hypothetical protein